MEKSAYLFMREGSSDKVYNIHLRQDDKGWTVAFENGRRGKALREGVKIAGATLEDASAVWDKSFKEKTRKGYTEQESGVAFSSTEMAGLDTGFRPQLYNEITHEDAMMLGNDWLVQEKHDGERRPLISDAVGVRFANRRGLETGIATVVADAFRQLAEATGGAMALDSEDMGDHVVIFDAPVHSLVQEGTFRERASVLANISKAVSSLGLGQALRVDVPIPAPEFFANHADQLRKRGAEGYVVRHVESRYEAGRPNSGGDALKVKFWADATCRVAPGRLGKSSIGLEMQDGVDGPWRAVGNVTVPQGRAMPEVGSLVDIRYLYAYEGGSIFQPVLGRARTDLTEEAAQMAQLKYKVEAPADDLGGPEV